jgi:hypothetical protein
MITHMGLNSAMRDWWNQLKFDPLPSLLSSKNESLLYFVRRDLLDEHFASVEALWQTREIKRILNRQLDGGAWNYPGGRKYIRSEDNYNQIETYRILGQLVEKHGLNRQHPAIRQAAEYLFSHQTEEGDFARGILGNQYAPYYSAAIMELLIKAGYDADSRIERGFRWLLAIRQNDGGWAIPLRTVGAKFGGRISWTKILNADTISPDLSKPFSHMVTGMVLRGFAAHSKHRKSTEAVAAGRLLASRFFKRDAYPDRQSVSFWTKFSYPFWFTDLLSALDSLSLMGFSRDNPQIDRALDWFIARQRKDGAWKLPLLRGKDKDLPLWTSLAICRVFKRLRPAIKKQASKEQPQKT